jgi:hypothetical protein
MSNLKVIFSVNVHLKSPGSSHLIQYVPLYTLFYKPKNNSQIME